MGARIAAEKRQAEAARIREKYPDRIPVGLGRAGPRRQRGVETPAGSRSSGASACPPLLPLLQVIVEKAERSDIPDIDKKK